MTLRARIEVAISSFTNQEAKFDNTRTTHGGCINDSRLVTLKDKRQFFIKTHPQANLTLGIFKSEFAALKLLAKPEEMHIPRPIVCDDDFIVMEVFQEGKPADNWQEQMGRGLAQLHLSTKQEQFGFIDDNYIGTTPQRNTWNKSWLKFWRDNRLAYQLKLFSAKTGKDDPLLEKGKHLINKLDSLIGHINESAVLLHGDLWSGNAAANEKGEPIIFDPASYYGHREAEISMMRMFGGFGNRCESAYAEIWPFEDGVEQRISLYRSYHELNHLNLFGKSYYQPCLLTINSLI